MTMKLASLQILPRVLGCAAIAVLLIGAAGCARTPEQKGNKFLSNGKALMEKKEYARAILEFKNAARLMPKSAETFYQLSLAYLDTGDFRTSGALLRHAAEVDPKHVPTQLRLAELMSGARQATPDVLNEAEQRAEAILAASPENPDALSILALAEFRLGKIEEARKHLEDALARFPDNLKAARTMALVRIAANDLAGAEQVLKKAAAQSPKAVEPELALGRFYLIAKRPADAEAAFQRAASIDPKNGPAVLDLASTQRALGHKDQAEKTYLQLSKLPEKEYRPIHAIYLFDEGQRDEAIKEFERLAKDDTNDPLAPVRLIRAYVDTKHFAEAERAMEARLKKNPKDTGVLVERAKLYLATGRIQDAQQDLTQVLRLEPGLAIAHFLLSKAHQSRGQEALRRQELTEAVKNDPSYLTARLELAASLIAANGAKTALDYLDQAPLAQKRSPELIAERNWALFATSDRVALRKSIDEGLSIQKTPDLLLQDGYLRFQMKDLSGARASLKKVLEINSEDTRALDALGKVDLMEKRPAVALATVRDYVSRHPASPALQYLLGDWLAQFNKPDEARIAFSFVLQAAPEFLGAKLKLADLDIAERKFDSARQRLESIAAVPAGKARAELLLGMIDEGKGGNPQSAAQHYRKALEADPNNVLALNNLAYHLANDAKQFDEALKIAQQAKELAPKDASVDDTIGWAYYNKGIYDSAVKYFESAVAGQPNARRRYHLAMGYFKAGNPKRAQAVFTEAHKMDPTLPEAAVAGRLIADSGKAAN